MSLLALLDHADPPLRASAVLADESEKEKLPLALPAAAAVIVREPGKESSLKNG